MADLLSETGMAAELATVPGWAREGAGIGRTFTFGRYMDGIRFVQQVAELAEACNHHPDIHIGWRKVTLHLTTHSKGGLTGLDFELARAVDGL